MLPFDGFALTPTLLPEAARNGTAATRPTGPAGPLAAVARGTRRLLAGWLALAVGSLVVAGLFAAVAAFARTPVVYRWFSAGAFQLALVGHVTFAFTVWFVAFAGALWVYVAWRAGYALPRAASWGALALAATGALLMAIPAVTGSGRPYLSDYVPSIDHPAFWGGLALVAVGVSLQATAYLVAYRRSRRRITPARAETLEAQAMAVGALAMLLATAVVLVALARIAPDTPLGYRLRVLFWGPGHLLQFLHVAGMIAVWFVTAAIAVGTVPSARWTLRWLVGGLVPFMLLTAGVYAWWLPEALLSNHLVTLFTFWGLGAGAVPVGLMLAAPWRRGDPAQPTPARLPWGSPLFSGTALSMALFAIGGILGVVGFQQDTRVPAHYHGMVGAVTLAYMGLAPLLLDLCGRRVWSNRLARWQPYLYGVGLIGIMAGMHWAGGHGAPRKTFGFGWANTQALIAMNVMGLGSLLAILGGLAFVVNVGWPLVRRPGGDSR
jgi:heme/copper-type cytochrome/quinol oxidase subunit 1